MTDLWTRGVEPVNGAGNIYANLVETFAAVLPGVSGPDMRTAREATRLLARSIVCADRVIDGAATGAAQVENVLAAQICQLDGTLLLQTLVPTGHAFWGSFAQRLREFAAACTDEATAVARPAEALASAERIALGKNALARITAPLACVLGRDHQLEATFDRAVTELILAVQALDDAADWRIDLAAHQISLITARIWAHHGTEAPAAEVARYVHGVAMREVLTQGRDALASAMALAPLRASPGWLTITGRIAAGYEHVLAALPRLAAGTPLA